MADEPENDELKHDDAVAPEEALADVRSQLAASEAARVAAEQRAQANAGQAASAQEIALSAALSSEEARLAAARAAYRNAREAGDLDKETDAQEEIAVARVRLESMKNQQAQMQRQRVQPQQQPDGVPGPAARAWIADHPEMDTNPAYRDAAIVSHNRALAAGHEPESPGYFQHINAELAQRFGKNHGRGGQAMPDQNKPQRPGPRASSFGTPPGRGNSTTAKSEADINAIANRLNVTPDQIREAAEFSGMPGKDTEARLQAYLKSQLQILAERDSSITYGDGAVYR